MKGKVVLVDFYATCCGPCMQSIPYNNELPRKYKDQGLVIVGACTSSQGQEKFAANAKEHGIGCPTWHRMPGCLRYGGGVGLGLAGSLLSDIRAG